MGQLSVALIGQQSDQFGRTCRESLSRFTPELEEIVEVAHDADLGWVRRRVSAAFVVFIDHRIAVSPGWAGRLIRAMEGSGVGAIGPLSNAASGAQRRPADYQDIADYLSFAEQIARDHGGEVQTVEGLDNFCVLTTRGLLGTLDSGMKACDLADAVRAAGYRLAVALDTYLHSFADYYEHVRPELLALIPITASRVLDIGCGVGLLGSALKRRGAVEVVGVEAHSEAAEAAKRVLDRLHLGDVESLVLPYDRGTFDCIVLADIIEHLRDPWELLRRLAPLLDPRGRLIASLPNVRHWSVVRGLLQGEWTYLPAGILDRAHLRFFTVKSGRALFEAAGMTVAEIHPVRAGTVPDLTRLAEALESLSLDPSTLAEESEVVQYLYVAEKRE